MILSSLVGILSIPYPVGAEPADIFKPVLSQILEQAPAGTQVRLPTQWFGTSIPKVVQVFTSRTVPVLTLGLKTCEGGTVPCLVGTLTVAPTAATNAQREYERHRAAFAPITLAPQVTGYFLDGSRQRPAIPFSSVMWQQDNTFYTLAFPNSERQNGLFTAWATANTAPLSVQTNP
jgi:hypothetical protein